MIEAPKLGNQLGSKDVYRVANMADMDAYE